MQVQFGEFTFDGDAREVRRGGTSVSLTPDAFDLFRILIEERPRAVHNNELRERISSEAALVEEASVRKLIAEIRSAMGPAAVRTVPRFGYAANIDAPVAARLLLGDRVYRLSFGANIIGRVETCRVTLDFAGVSRKHARIRVTRDACVLEDLRSKNGTWRNGERVWGTVELKDGDALRIGEANVVFSLSRDDS